uniref:Uncharacterized protein n=1 Tax=Populus trichocarpa TaxID=3694 RepID=A9P9Y2_POPTR|nr:unknown [Populus trichocarpa]
MISWITLLCLPCLTKEASTMHHPRSPWLTRHAYFCPSFSRFRPFLLLILVLIILNDEGIGLFVGDLAYVYFYFSFSSN